MDDLTAQAGLWGIVNGYHDVFGRWHKTSEESQTLANHGLVTRARQAAREFPLPAKRSAHFKAMAAGTGSWPFSFTRCTRGATGGMAISAISRRSSSSRRRSAPPHRAQPAACPVPRSRAGGQPLCAEQPHLHQSALHRRRRHSGISRRRGRRHRSRSAARRRLIDYVGVARAKLDACVLPTSISRRGARGSPRGVRALPERAGRAAFRFSCFEELRARFAGQPWPEWPEPWRHPALADLKHLHVTERTGCEFHEFLQWVADRQMAACQEIAQRCGMPVGLYVDVAVGMHPHGADAWSRQTSVLADVSVGAPPDEFNPAGQNWGLAPFNPAALAASDFAALRELMRSAMRHAGAIRLDHVLGLRRVFMIPRGSRAADGAYVRFPFEPSLQAIAQESLAARCIVIGEDLGTVPEGFRETMARWGLWRYLVMLFEREGDGRFRPPEAYPAEALATFNTHDLPSLRGWLDAHDLRTKRDLGLDPGESDEARARAQQSSDRFSTSARRRACGRADISSASEAQAPRNGGAERAGGSLLSRRRRRVLWRSRSTTSWANAIRSIFRGLSTSIPIGGASFQSCSRISRDTSRCAAWRMCLRARVAAVGNRAICLTCRTLLRGKRTRV